MEKIVIVECMGCKHKKEIKADELGKDEVPICDKCFMPMVAVKVIIK